jgi:hypothetical protein
LKLAGDGSSSRARAVSASPLAPWQTAQFSTYSVSARASDGRSVGVVRSPNRLRDLLRRRLGPDERLHLVDRRPDPLVRGPRRPEEARRHLVRVRDEAELLFVLELADDRPVLDRATVVAADVVEQRDEALRVPAVGGRGVCTLRSRGAGGCERSRSQHEPSGDLENGFHFQGAG